MLSVFAQHIFLFNSCKWTWVDFCFFSNLYFKQKNLMGFRFPFVKTKNILKCSIIFPSQFKKQKFLFKKKSFSSVILLWTWKYWKTEKAGYFVWKMTPQLILNNQWLVSENFKPFSDVLFFFHFSMTRFWPICSLASKYLIIHLV